MKHITVAAAVIVHEGKVLAMRRNYGEFAGGWEFPGGKLESGESPKDALMREMQEELRVRVRIEKYLGTLEYTYPNFHLKMICYICTIPEGKPALLVHDDAKWLERANLDAVDWLEADKIAVGWLKQQNF